MATNRVYAIPDDRIYSVVQDLGTLTTNTTINADDGNTIKFIAGGNITLKITGTNLKFGNSKLTFVITNGGIYNLVWPTNVIWLGQYIPVMKKSGIDIIYLTTFDNGVTWYGDNSSNTSGRSMVSFNTILKADVWSSINYSTNKYHTYTIVNTAISSNANINVKINSSTVNIDQINTYNLASIIVGNINDGSVELRAYDEIPLIDIPVTIMVEDSTAKLVTYINQTINKTGRPA